MPAVWGWTLVIEVNFNWSYPSNRTHGNTALEQLKVPCYLINLRGFIWPNSETSTRWLAVKLGPAAIRDQVNPKSHFHGFVINGHQFFFATAADTYLRKCSQNPGLLVGREIIDANTALALQPLSEKRHGCMCPLGDLLSSAHLQVVANYDDLFYVRD